MPVASIARQPRCLDAIDGTDVARTHHRHKPLKSGPLSAAGTRAAKIVVNYRHRFKSGGFRGLRQVILPPLAFEIPHHLGHCRLANIDDGGPAEVIRRDLDTHDPLPASDW